MLRAQSAGPIVLLYHNVEPTECVLVKALHITISPSDFAAHIEFLTNHFRLIPFSRLADHAADPQAVAITFDDGCKSVLTNALPVLERYNCPAKLYVTNEHIFRGIGWTNQLSLLLCSMRPAELGELASAALEPAANPEHGVTIYDFLRRFRAEITPGVVDEKFKAMHRERPRDLYLNEQELRRLSAHPLIELGSHTRRHYPLRRLNPTDLYDEVVNAHTELNAMFDHKVHGFCIPFGHRGEITQPVADVIRKVDRHIVSAYGGRFDGEELFGMPEVKRTGVWGNIGVLWHRMRWPS